MPEKQLYGIVTFFRRRPDLSEQEFYDHWGKVHGPLVIPWALKHGVLEYTQYPTPKALREEMALKMDPNFNTSIDFDAAAIWYIESYERYLAAYQDPYYLTVIEPDEQNFVDKGQLSGQEPGKKTIVRAISTLGVPRSMIKDGKPSVDVNDGILAKFKEFQDRGSNTD